jgi:hypothetical protein
MWMATDDLPLHASAHHSALRPRAPRRSSSEIVHTKRRARPRQHAKPHSASSSRGRRGRRRALGRTRRPRRRRRSRPGAS